MKKLRYDKCMMGKEEIIPSKLQLQILFARCNSAESMKVIPALPLFLSKNDGYI